MKNIYKVNSLPILIFSSVIHNQLILSSIYLSFYLKTDIDFFTTAIGDSDPVV